MLRADLPADERRWLVLDADVVLGLDLHTVWDRTAVAEAVPDDVVGLLRDRDVARVARDYAAADALRDRLGELGWEVIDAATGSSVRRRT
jgi:cysteinyl-tRNA synthetase